ncbi:unnamed protein product [Cyprideis torosa]|uniref:Uncharacterized protein n=1 Tax=Cyprideis torosa TaxID=163714 RepID=A0A7R8W4V1_9CRUS|nr:unnamed protein product [Cyprideis torosa]CAG0884580.1 unnamed protein product [Cyprideis torosa]
MIGLPTLVESLVKRRIVPETEAYLEYIGLLEEKFTDVEEEFHSSPAMTQDVWKNSLCENRHLTTRFSSHGFHFKLQEYAWVDQKVRCYTRYFTKFGVNGRRLLVMDASDLATMGIWKVGHQEIILGAIALLKHCHFVLQKENLQTLFLELGAKASSLARQLHLRQGELGTGDTVQPAPSSRGPYSSVVSYVTSNGVTKRDRKGGVSTDCIAAVADLMISLKQCITWLDRAPFRHQPSMDSLKRELLTVAVQLAATTQRDFFADEPEGNIAVMCGKLESTCEQMVQCATDSLVITPASLELVKIAKKDDCDNELGLHISSSFKGVHSVGMVSRDVLQRAHGRVQEGDDILRVDHQTVVGWQLMEVVALIRRSGREVSLTVKRQPHHVTPQRRKVYPASIRPLRHNPASSISASTPPSVTSTPAKTACKTQLPQHTEEEQGGGSSGGQSTASPSSSASLTPSSVVMAPSVSSHFEEDGTKEPAPIRLASEEDDDVPPSPPPVPPRLMLEHVSSPSNAQRKQSLLSAKPMIVRRATVIGIQPSMGSTEATEFEEDDQIDVPLEETVISRGIVTRTISAPPIKKSGPPPPLVVPSTADTPHHQSPQPPPTPPRSSAPPPIPERRPTMVTPSTPALPPRQQPPPSPSLIVTKASDVQQSSVFNPVYHSPPPGQPPITPPRKEPPSPPPALPARLHPPPPGRRVPPPPPPPPRQPTSSSPRIVAAASAFSSSESSCTSGAHSQFPGLNRDRMTTYRRPGVSSANPQTSNTVTISGRITSGNWRLGNRSSTEPSPGDLCAVPNRYECVPSSSPPAPMARRSVGGPIVTTAAEGPISPSSEQSSTLSSPASSSISWHSSSSSTTAGHGGGTTTTNSSATSSPPLRHQPPPGHAYSHLPHSSSSSSSLSSTSSTGVPPSHDSLLTIGEGCLSTTPTSSSTAVSPSSSTLTASHSSSSSLNRESVVTALDPPPVFVPAQMRPGIQQLQPTPESQNRRPGSGAIDSTRLH